MRAAWVLAAVGVLVGGCSAHRTPDLRPAPPANVQATLSHFPLVSIVGQPLTLTAKLADQANAVPCPSHTWTWPNGTHSSHTSDCAPGEVGDHVVRWKCGDLATHVPCGLPSGDWDFRITWTYEGRTWSADDTVHVQ